MPAYAPVLLGGRWLVDGAMAAHSGVLEAASLGASAQWLADGGDRLTDQARFLAHQDHGTLLGGDDWIVD